MSSTHGFWRDVARRLEAGERVFLALVADNTRHSPGTAGARLLVSETGERAGTIGGGIMEYQLIERAAGILRDGGDLEPEIRTLHHQRSAAGERSGMICAGSQTNLYLLCRPERELAALRRAALLLEAGRSGTLEVTREGLVVAEAEGDLARPPVALERGAGGWRYAEQLLNRRRLAVLGGGHCAAALTHAMARLGYDVFVFETREGVADPELERDARAVELVTDFRDAGPRVAYPELTWVVVMTTDLPNDVKALTGVLDLPFPFVGVMGAPAKIEEIRARLGEYGFSRARLDRIHAPVGLPIPSHTPEEIAISVAAQILELRAGTQAP